LQRGHAPCGELNEIVGGRVVIGDTRGRVYKLLAVIGHFVGLHIVYHKLFVALTQCVLHRRQQPLGILVGNLKPVDNQLYGVVLVSVETHAAFNLSKDAIDTHIDKAFLGKSLEQLFVVALSALDKRCENINLTARIFLYDKRHYLFVCVLHHFLPRHITAGMADARVQQTQKIVYLGGSAYGASRVAVHRLLLDSYHRAEACDAVHIRALEISEHVARIRRKCLDIAALPFGKDCVEGKRRLTRT